MEEAETLTERAAGASSTHSPFNDLPDEVVVALLSSLATGDDAARCAMVSRRFASLTRDPSVQNAWRGRFEASIAALGVDPKLPVWEHAAAPYGWHWMACAALPPRGEHVKLGCACVVVECTPVPLAQVTLGELVDGLLDGWGVIALDAPKPSWSCGRWSRGNMVQGIAVYAGASGWYEGQMLADLHHGRGVFELEDGSRYEGEWRWGQRCGRGREVFCGTSSEMGWRYEGQYDRDRFHGRGTAVWSDGSRYEGEWRWGLRWGRGVDTSPGGRQVYEGQFERGTFSGAGTMMVRDGRDRVRGTWHAGKAHGAFVSTACDCALSDDAVERRSVLDEHHAHSPRLCTAFGSRIVYGAEDGRCAGPVTIEYANGDRYSCTPGAGYRDKRGVDGAYVVSPECPDPRFRGVTIAGRWITPLDDVFDRTGCPDDAGFSIVGCPFVCPHPVASPDAFAQFRAYHGSGLLPVRPGAREVIDRYMASVAIPSGPVDRDASAHGQ
jgi:hypothetical protein